MKTKLMYPMILVMLYAFAGAIAARAQLAHISGRVADNDKPLAGAQVIYKSVNSGRTFKVKTDSKGQFFSVGVPDDSYTVTVIDADGKTVFTHDDINVGESGDNVENVLDIDLTKGVSVKTPKGASMGGAGGAGGRTSEFHGEGPKGSTAGTKKEATISKEEMERLKAERDKGLNLNALITQYNTAAAAKNWQEASDTVQKMIIMDPNRWEYKKAMGDVQLNLGQYQEAVDTYEKTLPLAQNASKTDPKADPAKTKAVVAQMLTNEGNAYLKLKKNPEAIAAYTKAAEMDPNPGTAYFNLCATQYNAGNAEGALPACDKAITADPNRADAYFIKGSLLMGSSTMDKQGKLQAPAGTAEALNKYLELAPDGPHANDVKQMLGAIGAKIETTYHEKGKKK
ncbi:MAG: tetratricopeptide repeat protein [Candidatus Angelobacter sp.]